jgi:hypothetical protein
MKKIVGLIAVVAIAVTSSPSHAADKRLANFAGKYVVSVGTVGSNPATSVLYTSPSDNYNSSITVSKSGSLSGKWGRFYTTEELRGRIQDNADEGGSTNESTYDVTLKGKITKISSSKLYTTASFTFTLSDGAKGSGTIKTINWLLVRSRFGNMQNFLMNGKLRLGGNVGSLYGSK